MRQHITKVALILAISTIVLFIYKLFLQRVHYEDRVAYTNNLDDSILLRSLQELVSSTNGFYTRDWSLYLGWNNMRYIIEASVLHAQILNRTLVLPTYVNARSCEFSIDTCEAYFYMINRFDARDANKEFLSLPLEKQLGWRVPLSMMLDLPLLRKRHPVILLSEYLMLYGLPENIERADGSWDREAYHNGTYIFHPRQAPKSKQPSLYVIQNSWFDGSSIARVDEIPGDMKERGKWSESAVDLNNGSGGEWGPVVKNATYERLKIHGGIIEWWDAQSILGEEGYNTDTDEDTIKGLREIGWEVLYTYGSYSYPMESVVDPKLVAAARCDLRGLKDDFGGVTEDVLLLEGETHNGRPPSALRFTSSYKRDDFARIVLQDIRPPSNVYQFSEKLIQRMFEKVNGRLWMGAHMRRGDFVTLGWVAEPSIQAYTERVKNRLENGRNKIIDIQQSTPITYNVPDVMVDRTVMSKVPPEENDPFYLATDERSHEDLQHLREQGAVLAMDLITPEDRRTFGPGLLLTDVVGIIDQAVLARAAYFWGHYYSSFTGGIFNMRAARGVDPRTTEAD